MSNFVIIDLEMCNVPRGEVRKKYNFSNEIIQIGAAVLDETLEVVDLFSSFVSPEFGEIDEFIHNLTGISKEDTQGAPGIKEALEKLISWLPEDAVFVSWSKTDKSQIVKELGEKGLEVPGLAESLDDWVDCQKIFTKKMEARRAYGLSEALVIAGIDYADGAHDAMVDAYNTALLFAKMQREEKMTLVDWYVVDPDEQVYINSAFAEVLASYSWSA